MSHTLRSLFVMTFVGLIIAGLWLTAWASADPGRVIIRAEPLAAGAMLESTHATPYQYPSGRPSAAARAQIF